jgi:multidrug efflux system membrane fusion protein
MDHRSRTHLIDRSTSLTTPFAALLLAASLLLLGGCSGEPNSTAELAPTPRPVRTIEAVEVDLPARQRFPGALRARERAALAFLHPGTLAERHVRLGQSVAAGEALATLHNPALQPGVAAAEGRVLEARTRLQQLQLDVERQATLVERRLISDDALDQTRTRRDAARATLDQAQASLDEARNQLADAQLRAPFAGVIARFMAEPGDFVAAGQPVMQLVDPNSLEVEIALPGDIDIDAVVAISVLHPARGEQAPGRLDQSGSAEPGRPRAVRIAVAPEAAMAWQSGDAVQVELDLESPPALMVPLAALIDPGTGFARLFRVRDQRAEQVAVLTGRLQGDRIAVTGDLAAGDAVVVAGQALLLHGETVRVLP